MKRKFSQEDSLHDETHQIRKRLAPPSSKEAFRSDLFTSDTIASFRKSYTASQPYPHAVVHPLIQPQLLRSVRDEIKTHISFTPKETDIYRIHQSGDLANLSNLDSESLKHLPSLVKLRDALYSYEFRHWVSKVTGAGKVSGQKTDMAVNVYTPGSYLLCHDDVIGSRRVSYILYLTDPDNPWQASWGGGLRLYPTQTKVNKAGEEIKVPLPEHSVNIPPSFCQLSMFAVRPGESYHDVEEVYYSKIPEENKLRIRMAISGWYHIPQDGEDGYEEGAEEAQAERSSLAQLEGAADEFDEPAVEFRHFDEARIVATRDAQSQEMDPGDEGDADEEILTEQDLTFLLQYLAPSFLTPDMTDRLASSFEENSFLQLEKFLNDRFAGILKNYIEDQERSTSESADAAEGWRTARPPHKHRYRYLRTAENTSNASPISKLLIDLLHSHAFKKWFALITGFQAPSLTRQDTVVRRFRRGHDYALANGYQGEEPRLEFTINITPSTGWETEDETESDDTTNGHPNGTANSRVKVETNEMPGFGGEEVYMAGDEDDESIHSKSLPQVGKKADPAIYRSAHDDEDDGILFTNPASWNTLSIVLRDKGTLRFVKYVSQAANGDRWDIKGEVELSGDAFHDDEERNVAASHGVADDHDDECGEEEEEKEEATEDGDNEDDE